MYISTELVSKIPDLSRINTSSEEVLKRAVAKIMSESAKILIKRHTVE